MKSKTKIPETVRARQKKRRARLHALAKNVGYDTWPKLETAALRNEVRIQKVSDPAAELRRRYGLRPPPNLSIRLDPTEELKALSDALRGPTEEQKIHMWKNIERKLKDSHEES